MRASSVPVFKQWHLFAAKLTCQFLPVLTLSGLIFKPHLKTLFARSGASSNIINSSCASSIIYHFSFFIQYMSSVLPFIFATSFPLHKHRIAVAAMRAHAYPPHKQQGTNTLCRSSCIAIIPADTSSNVCIVLVIRFSIVGKKERALAIKGEAVPSQTMLVY